MFKNQPKLVMLADFRGSPEETLPKKRRGLKYKTPIWSCAVSFYSFGGLRK
jgi:hypothetical protein